MKLIKKMYHYTLWCSGSLCILRFRVSFPGLTKSLYVLQIFVFEFGCFLFIIYMTLQKIDIYMYISINKVCSIISNDSNLVLMSSSLES